MTKNFSERISEVVDELYTSVFDESYSGKRIQARGLPNEPKITVSVRNKAFAGLGVIFFRSEWQWYMEIVFGTICEYSTTGALMVNNDDGAKLEEVVEKLASDCIDYTVKYLRDRDYLELA